MAGNPVDRQASSVLGAAGADDDRFELLGRRSGAELRRPPTEAELAAIGGAARDRRRRQVAGVVGVLVLAATAAWWTSASQRDGLDPTDSTIDSIPPDAPSTVAPAPDAFAFGELTFQFITGSGVELRTRSAGSDAARPAWEDLLPGVVHGHLDWTADGRQAVVTVETDVQHDLWVVDLGDGPGAETARRVVECSDPCKMADEAAWSPDGASLAYWRYVQDGDVGTATLEQLDLTTGETTVLVNAAPGTALLAPRWSPDGTRLVVEQITLAAPTWESEPVSGAIGLLDLGALDRGVRLLTDPRQFGNNPDWSPSGDVLVYAERVPGGSTLQDLFLLRLDGSAPERLTRVAEDGDMAVQPTFVPDGTAVLFVVRPGAVRSPVVRIVGVDGGSVAPLADGAEIHGEFPRIRPIPAT